MSNTYERNLRTEDFRGTYERYLRDEDFRGEIVAAAHRARAEAVRRLIIEPLKRLMRAPAPLPVRSSRMLHRTA